MYTYHVRVVQINVVIIELEELTSFKMHTMFEINKVYCNNYVYCNYALVRGSSSEVSRFQTWSSKCYDNI